MIRSAWTELLRLVTLLVLRLVMDMGIKGNVPMSPKVASRASQSNTSP